MDVYGTEPVDGEALLENTDVAALEQNVEEQAVASGFADLVAGQVSEMAMRTESFEDLQELLAEELRGRMWRLRPSQRIPGQWPPLGQQEPIREWKLALRR